MSRAVSLMTHTNFNNFSLSGHSKHHVDAFLLLRKQKCGGLTSKASCMTCQDRGVRCSFEHEAKDPRYNPYLRIQSATPTAQSVHLDRLPESRLFTQTHTVHHDDDRKRTEGGSSLERGPDQSVLERMQEQCVTHLSNLMLYPTDQLKSKT